MFGFSSRSTTIVRVGDYTSDVRARHHLRSQVMFKVIKSRKSGFMTLCQRQKLYRLMRRWLPTMPGAKIAQIDESVVGCLLRGYEQLRLGQEGLFPKHI